MSDYQESIQNPTTCFFDDELKNGTPILNNLGLPKPIAGGFACVYQLICGSHNYAVRCFLTQQVDLEQRYKTISDYLNQIKLPFMVSFEFLPKGIYVNGQWFPILKMEWIDQEITRVEILSKDGNLCRIHAGGKVRVLRDGKRIHVKTHEDGSISFDTAVGGIYRLLKL